MTKRQAPGDNSSATRFKKGQSGNPKGRPRKPKPPPSSPFAILDEMLTVHEQEGVTKLPLEDAMLIKTYQLAITGSRRAAKRIVKMIIERYKSNLQSQAPRAPRITRKVEHADPEDALEALEVLGIASRRANAHVDDSRNVCLRLERWAVGGGPKASKLRRTVEFGHPLHPRMDSQRPGGEMAEELS
jgi:hypothetical protein